MLKIRLTRFGKKHQPVYRVVVTPKENSTKGQYIDLLGTYDPRSGDFVFDNEKTVGWLSKGAKPSNRLARLLQAKGLEHPSIVVKQFLVREAKKAGPSKVIDTPKPVAEQPEQTEEPMARQQPKTPGEVEGTEKEPVEKAEVDTENEQIPAIQPADGNHPSK